MWLAYLLLRMARKRHLLDARSRVASSPLYLYLYPYPYPYPSPYPPHPSRDPCPPHPNSNPDPNPDQVAYYFTGCTACATLSGLAAAELAPSEQGVPSLLAGLVLVYVESSATESSATHSHSH